MQTSNWFVVLMIVIMLVLGFLGIMEYNKYTLKRDVQQKQELNDLIQAKKKELLELKRYQKLSIEFSENMLRKVREDAKKDGIISNEERNDIKIAEIIFKPLHIEDLVISNLELEINQLEEKIK